jgi:hypothetical protein
LDGPTALPDWNGVRPEILTDDELILWAGSLGPEAGVEIHRRAIGLLAERFASPPPDPTPAEWRLWNTYLEADQAPLDEPVDMSEWTDHAGRLTPEATRTVIRMWEHVYGS